MALATPNLNTISAFDATNSQIFTFNVSGGTQVTGNTLTIKDNATLTTVYSETVTTFQYSHALPANTLTNGTYYIASLTTQDADGNVSSVSNTIQFYCYTTPTFAFTNVSEGSTIANSSFNFTVQYNQAQSQIINTYVFNLYDASGVLISTSGSLYNTDISVPISLSYLFSGFENNTQYKIQCNGVFAQGFQFSTDLISFTVNYEQPTQYSYLELKNNCNEGYISVISHGIGITSYTNPSPPVYIQNKEVDLTADDSYVKWLGGYTLSDDWTMGIWGRAFIPNSSILEFSNTNGDKIYVNYISYADVTDLIDINCHIEVRVIPSGFTFGYEIYSNIIEIPDDDEQLFIMIRKNGGLYNVEVTNRGVIT